MMAVVRSCFSSRWTVRLREQCAAGPHRLSSAATSPEPTSTPSSKRRVVLVRSIDKLNLHGDGVGTYVSQNGVGMQVVVPFAAPGDEIQAELWSATWTRERNGRQISLRAPGRSSGSKWHCPIPVIIEHSLSAANTSGPVVDANCST
ncbi:Nucleic acid-binding, OB-fold [Phytophthora cactorum]|nr:Nucleic acid-binding, OB-fold [Phytophthora cactorum]